MARWILIAASVAWIAFCASGAIAQSAPPHIAGKWQWIGAGYDAPEVYCQIYLDDDGGERVNVGFSDPETDAKTFERVRFLLSRHGTVQSVQGRNFILFQDDFGVDLGEFVVRPDGSLLLEWFRPEAVDQIRRAGHLPSDGELLAASELHGGTYQRQLVLTPTQSQFPDLN